MNGNPFAMPLVFGLDQQRVPLGELTAMHGQILQMNAKIEDLTRKLDSEKKKKSIGLVGSITMVIKVQAAWRRKAQLREYCIMLSKVRPAVIKLQTAARRTKAVKAYLARVAMVRPAATKLQAAARRQKALRSYLNVRRSAIKLQAAARRTKAVKAYLARVAMVRPAATKLQAAARRQKAKQAYGMKTAAAIMLHAAARRMLAVKAYQTRLAEVRPTVIKLQAAVRRQIAVQAFCEARAAAVAVQAAEDKMDQLKMMHGYANASFLMSKEVKRARAELKQVQESDNKRLKTIDDLAVENKELQAFKEEALQPFTLVSTFFKGPKGKRTMFVRPF